MYKIIFEYKNGKMGECIENGKIITFATFEDANAYAENLNTMIDDDLKDFFPVWKAIKCDNN